MKKQILCSLLMAAMLTGCGGTSQGNAGVTLHPPTAQPQQSGSATAAAAVEETAAPELGRPAQKDLEFTVAGQRETVPSTLYVGQGYSIYIPNLGWRLEQDFEDGVPEQHWESTQNDDVELTVAHYSGQSSQAARANFAAEHDDYVFDNLLGGEWGNPLVGSDREGDQLAFMSYDGDGMVYIVAWEYPAAEAESTGARLRQMAETFALMV